MSKGWKLVAVIALIALTLGGLLLPADDMPSEVDELGGIEFVLGIIALSSVFWLPVIGALGLIALANSILRR